MSRRRSPSGYATPTILVDGRDLFGLDEPEPPYAPPSRRLHAGGVPSEEDLQRELRAMQD